MMDAVHRYEGTVSQASGDGIMALFGAPIAHEDHAVRACYAALALQDGMHRYAERARRTHGALVEARVGLNSGEVVVRLISDDLRMDYNAMGPDRPSCGAPGATGSRRHLFAHRRNLKVG
jgi:class 3 adenylate cyclase